MLNLPMAEISPTRKAIEWEKIISPANIYPRKYFTKQEALAIVKREKLPHTSIERMLFRFDWAWVIFDGCSYFGIDLKYHPCMDYQQGWKRTTNWNVWTQTYQYFWDKEKAIESIPLTHKTHISMSIHSPSGDLVFGRKFDN